MLHIVLGPVDDDLVQEFFLDPGESALRPKIDPITMEGLMVAADVFSSKGQARKAGFFGPIPMGIHLLGTNKKRFWCWCHPSVADQARKCDHRCYCPWKDAANP